jgi:shikimate dehydrogenase
MTQRFAVIGNPIQHSHSPEIHQHFAQQFGIELDYQKRLSDEQHFAEDVQAFFAGGGKGLNVTLPFKQQAYTLAQVVTKEAKQAQSVNTLYRNEHGQLCGDTTDGRGLLNDLTRLQLIEPNQPVLVLGAGGAARAIIPVLLNLGCPITLINRTLQNAERLANEFAPLGSIRLCEKASGADKQPRLIINTLPMNGAYWLTQYKITELAKTRVYDISYGERAQDFLNWCRQHQCTAAFDGWGMLVEQAALAFYIWHGVSPDTQALHRSTTTK